MFFVCLNHLFNLFQDIKLFKMKGSTIFVSSVAMPQLHGLPLSLPIFGLAKSYPSIPPGPSASRHGCAAVLVRPPPASYPTGRVSEAFQKRSVLPAGSQFVLIWAYFLDRLLCTDKVNNNCNIPVINDMNQRCVAVF